MRQGAEARIYRGLADEAMRQKSAAGVLIAAISNKESAFAAAFLPNAVPNEPVDEVALFTTVNDSLRALVEEARAGGCVTVAYENPAQEPGANDPFVKVGWAKHVATVSYGSGEDAIVPHTRVLTNEGQMVINHWLHQRGEEVLPA